MNQVDHFDADAADARRELGYLAAQIRLEHTRRAWNHFLPSDAREPDDDEPEEQSE